MLVTGLPAESWRWLYPPRLRRLSRPVIPFEGRFFGGGSCRASAFLAGWPDLLSAPGTSLAPSYIAIVVPFMNMFSFNNLHLQVSMLCLDSRSVGALRLQKTIECCFLSLAIWAEMGAPPTHHNPADRRLAVPAGLTRTPVDAVFQLEETAHSRGVHIVRH